MKNYKNFRKLFEKSEFVDGGNLEEKRDKKLNFILGYKDYDEMIKDPSYSSYITEKLGLNTLLNNNVIKSIEKYTGKTQAFLYLYYLSFKDEISCNIQSFHKEIGNNNIKTTEEFKKFLYGSNLYTEARKMKNIDIFKCWDDIRKEQNNKNLIHDLGIGNLDTFLKKTSNQIQKAGDEYMRKMSRIFL